MTSRTPAASPARGGDPFAVLPRGGLVKICGLREPEHAAAAVAAGVDLLGFVFAPARRRVTPEQARRCLAAARTAAGGRLFLGVGVFVDATVAEMNDVADLVGLDLVQLHGDESPETPRALNRAAVKAVHPPPGIERTAVSQTLDRFRDRSVAPVAFLLDGHSPTAAGGAGIRADWTMARHLARSYPLLLAGGLDPENVEGAIAAARPLGVDVSSGVESEGVKDPARIVAFVTAARLGFARLAPVGSAEPL